MLDKTQLGTAAVAAGCCALCAAQCWAARAPRAAEQLIRTPAHRHPQFPGLPNLDCAQRSSVVRVPRFLSTADIEAVHRAAEAGAEGAPQLVRALYSRSVKRVSPNRDGCWDAGSDAAARAPR